MKPLSTGKSPFENPPKVGEKIQWVEPKPENGRQLNEISRPANGILSDRDFVPTLRVPNVGGLIPPK
jgi:hypothetical protein